MPSRSISDQNKNSLLVKRQTDNTTPNHNKIKNLTAKVCQRLSPNKDEHQHSDSRLKCGM